MTEDKSSEIEQAHIEATRKALEALENDIKPRASYPLSNIQTSLKKNKTS